MYAKLFTSIYQGTLRGNSHGLLVFTNLLAHADMTGFVDIHPKAIAEEVGISREQVQAAIDELEAPDPESRSPEEGGRRIVRVDAHRAWGWKIVNHGKYQAIRNEEDRREQNRLAQQRWREKKIKTHQQSAHISTRKHQSSESAHIDVDVDVEENTPIAPKGAATRFVRFWAAYPAKVGKDAARKAFDKRKPSEDMLATMLAAIESQKASPKWLKDAGQFIPNPATWLNQGRWQDEGSDAEQGSSARRSLFEGAI